MDSLSNTLRAVRLAGSFLAQAQFTAPWSYRPPRAEALARARPGGADRVAAFLLVSQGQCQVDVPGARPLQLVAGDAVLFPRGDGHLLGSSPGHADATQLVCGSIACDALVGKAILEALPSIVRVNLRGGPGASGWLEAAVRHALREAEGRRPGADGLLAKLAEVVFIEILRLHQQSSLQPAPAGLAGRSERILGAAIGALHGQPGRNWTIGSLARHIGTSRTVLAERFQLRFGTPPMQYLTRWRMRLAANLLATGDLTLVQIAQEVGYQTDSSLSRAFRREYGLPPARWRRAWKAGAAAAHHVPRTMAADWACPPVQQAA